MPGSGRRPGRPIHRREPRAGAVSAGHTTGSAMSGIARTSATGQGGMLPELLAWSSSFRDDRARSCARTSWAARRTSRCWRARASSRSPTRASCATRSGPSTTRRCAGTLELPPDEEDVHMAVEAELGKRVGARGGAPAHGALAQRSGRARPAASRARPGRGARRRARRARRRAGRARRAREGRAAAGVHAPPARAAGERRVPRGVLGHRRSLARPT